MRKIISTLFILMSSICFADQVEDEISRVRLTKQEPPTGGITVEKKKLNSYLVEQKNSALHIATFAFGQKKGLNNRTLDINGYKLQGIDKGEWGGALILYSPNKKPVNLLRDNVRNIHVFNGTIYVFTGLAHMTYNSGSVYKVTDIETDPKISLVTLLPSAPTHVISDDRSIYILTSNGLVALENWNNSFTLKVIAHDVPWSGFAPNSLIKINKTFVIGMHTGVTTVKDGGYGRYDVTYYGK